MERGGPQPVKVLSPEILQLTEVAEVIFNTEGNILRRVMASGAGAPGVEGRRASRPAASGDVPATTEPTTLDSEG